MKKLTAAVDRVLLAIIGAALVFAGIVAVAQHYDARWAGTLLSRVERRTVEQLPAQGWWHSMLMGAAVGATLVGLFLLIGNVARRRTHTLQLATSHPDAHVTVDLDALSIAVARELTAFPGVYRTRAQAIDDRGLPTLSITVRAYPELDIDGFTRFAEHKAQHVAYAVDGARVSMRVQLHIEPKSAVQTEITT